MPLETEPTRPRHPPPDVVRRHTGPVVVVAYDGTECSRAAVVAAGRRAGPCGTIVVLEMRSLMRAWLGTPSNDTVRGGPELDDDQVLAGFSELGGDVLVVAPSVRANTPAEALVRAAQACDAAEIVVGSEPLGRFRAVNGSLSQALLAIADRPVVVVPTPRCRLRELREPPSALQNDRRDPDDEPK